MTYEVKAIVPNYDFRDAIVGASAVTQPGGPYHTLAYAHAVAARLGVDGDDVSYVVVPTGGSAFTDAIYPVSDAGFDDIPF